MSGGKFSRQYAVVAETRRCWSDAEKDAIIAEAERPGVNISAVARRHGIKPSLLFRWRRLARDAKGHRSGPAFIPITLALPAAEAKAPPVASDPDTSSKSSLPTAAAIPQPTDERIEIELGNGYRVRIGADADIAALQRILDVLERR
jgi:transposase